MKLLIFTRYPEAGSVKTRLIPTLGADGARNLHRKMAEHTIKRLDCLTAEMEVCFTGRGEKEMQEWLGKKRSYSPQGGGDLGQRLLKAFAQAFCQGEDKVVVVGTDCPDLTAAHVQEAFHLLDEFDLVLGPAADGGYYLLGLNRLYKDLFESIPWGTGEVLQATLNKAKLLGINTVLLERLADVDRPKDLEALFKRTFKLLKRL